MSNAIQAFFAIETQPRSESARARDPEDYRDFDEELAIEEERRAREDEAAAPATERRADASPAQDAPVSPRPEPAKGDTRPDRPAPESAAPPRADAETGETAAPSKEGAPVPKGETLQSGSAEEVIPADGKAPAEPGDFVPDVPKAKPASVSAEPIATDEAESASAPKAAVADLKTPEVEPTTATASETAGPEKPSKASANEAPTPTPTGAPAPTNPGVEAAAPVPDETTTAAQNEEAPLGGSPLEATADLAEEAGSLPAGLGAQRLPGDAARNGSGKATGQSGAAAAGAAQGTTPAGTAASGTQAAPSAPGAAAAADDLLGAQQNAQGDPAGADAAPEPALDFARPQMPPVASAGTGMDPMAMGTQTKDGGIPQIHGVGETRNATALPLRAEAQAPVRTPQDIAVRIAKGAEAGQTRFEIRLDPPELGRIDIRLEVSQEGRVQAVLQADKPETLEMLQRDARALERALQDQGLDMSGGGLNFALRDQTPDGGGHGYGDAAAQDAAEDALAADLAGLEAGGLVIERRLGVDMRI